MLFTRISLTTTTRIWRCSLVRGLTSSSPKDSAEFPNPPLNLDPSLQDLLKDVDISLLKHKGHKIRSLHELEVIPENFSVDADAGDLTSHQVELEEDTFRKSPAARFGSQAISTVILPQQLQSTINLLINDTDKSQLHSDAKRLFYEGHSKTGQPGEWEAQYDKKYRSRQQTERHGERDGAAFVSVALPAHFAAILSVFEHLKRRLDVTWQPNRVIEWGSGTGSGLWASLYSFQKAPMDINEPQQLEISESSIKTYVGIDKREGLVAIGKRLFRNIELGGLSMSWQKSFKAEDQITRREGWGTVALSAFMLTTLPTSLAKKALAKEMWESGAHTMVFIDHNTVAGFEAIAHVREYLLKMGRLETEDPETADWPIKGSHVVAPCPHDKNCPLLQTGSKLVCGFSQRVQRPSFVRLTKHSNIGHEDIEYSYVVIQRGSRPALPTRSVGRVGEIGRQALHKAMLAQVPMKELTLHDEHDAAVPTELYVTTSTDIANVSDSPAPLELLEALRLEAYHWPRLVFPPLKKSGHIILDSCTTEGKIVRMTIPKSQGKQEYYDARKSNWGDIFPHPPKNRPQVRDIPCKPKRGLDSTVAGSDIGKRSRPDKLKDRPSYAEISETLREQRKKSKWDKIRIKEDRAWDD